MRNHELIDKYTRVDMQCEQLATDLMSANALIEQLRNDTANLRAEKNIWEVRVFIFAAALSLIIFQSVQSRLIDENKALSVERSHLADLMVNVQRMHSDLERSGENDRRRLESQIQMLENQTYDLLLLSGTVYSSFVQTRPPYPAESGTRRRPTPFSAKGSRTQRAPNAYR